MSLMSSSWLRLTRYVRYNWRSWALFSTDARYTGITGLARAVVKHALIVYDEEPVSYGGVALDEADEADEA
jgi:hypothetical protein